MIGTLISGDSPTWRPWNPGGVTPAIVKGVPAILKELKKRGYTFVTVTTLLGKDLKPGKVYP